MGVNMSEQKTTEDFITARKKIFDSIKAEMLGPGSEDIGPDIKNEVISDSPIKRYSIGILYPQKNKIKQEKDELIDAINSDEQSEYEELDNDTENSHSYEGSEKKVRLERSRDLEIEDDIDEEINMANQYLPSSMGFTFFTKGNLDYLNVRVNCAQYRLSTYEDCCVNFNGMDEEFSDPLFSEFLYHSKGTIRLKKSINFADINRLKSSGLMDKYDGLENAIYKLCSQCTDSKYKKYGYVREIVKLDSPIKVNIKNNCEKIIIGGKVGLELAIVKRRYVNNTWSFTIMLVNTHNGDPKISNTFFQPEVSVLSDDNPDLIFVECISNPYNNKDEEEESLELLYRNKKNYATGHGVSIVSDVSCNGHGFVRTEFMPLYEVAGIDFEINEMGDLSDMVLPMKNLSDISEYNRNQKVDLLRRFANTYKKWIDKLEGDLSDLDIVYINAARRHVEDCKLAYKRIIEGICQIESTDDVYTAFCLANSAMLMQRAHSQNKERFLGDEELQKHDYSLVNDKDASWRAFQLAFILMSIKSIANPDCEDRDILDLIWVPTGGGKTEAYLGLTAFTIFLRRLREPITGEGTAIIMRYTLRLLAAQQFVRASILICACEKIRRNGKYNLGKEPITIGLWIGSGSTPNTNKEAKECINKLISSDVNELEHNKDRYNKFQLLKCPWCGTKMVKQVEAGKVKGKWGYGSGKATLFCPEEECEFDGFLPIQVVDEEIYKNPPTLLFGTVDKFAMMTWKAEVSRLFALDEGNSNKSPELIIQDELHLISGPLGTVVGLYETAIDAMCSEKGIKPKIIASTATIRRAKEQCKNLYTRDVKQFPSPGLVAEDSFFVREIPVDKRPGRLYCGIMSSGKTQTTVEIRLMAAMLQKLHMLDIPDYIKDKYWTLVTYFNSIRELGKCSTLVDDDIKDAMRRLASRLENRSKTRAIFEADELTGRVPSGQIIKTLDRLENEYSKENLSEKKYPVNVLLASNMISVGVDVSRLNLMLIVGQPKLTSEYIQASSRVGRRYPGLVFTLFDGARSRDRSHFEQFCSYHQSFYRYVEPTSVTPFSEPVRDRALHAVLISMMRHIGKLNSEEMASAFECDSENVKKIEKYLIERIEKIDTSLVDDTKKDVKDIWDEWSKKIFSLSCEELLTYTKVDKKHLIRPFGKNDVMPAIETLQSMRNVDVQSGVNILVFGDDDDDE